MIGEIVQFNTKEKEWINHPNRPGGEYHYVKSHGRVVDKISEVHGHVSPGWAHSSGSNNVAVQETRTYYMISDRQGKIHRVDPGNILSIIEQAK